MIVEDRDEGEFRRSISTALPDQSPGVCDVGSQIPKSGALILCPIKHRNLAWWCRYVSQIEDRRHSTDTPRQTSVQTWRNP